MLGQRRRCGTSISPASDNVSCFLGYLSIHWLKYVISEWTWKTGQACVSTVSGERSKHTYGQMNEWMNEWKNK